MGRIDTYPQNAVLQPNSPVTLGYAQQTSELVTFSAETDIPGLTLNVVVPEGRRIRVSARVSLASPTIANDEFALWLSQDGVHKEVSARRNPNVGDFMDISVALVLSPTAGNHTYKASVQRTTGTGFVTTTGTQSDRPAFILVEDITGMPLPAATVSVPVGLLSQAQVTTNQTGITTEADLTGLTVNITVPAGRTLRVRGTTYPNTGVLDDRITLYIKEGSSYLTERSYFVRNIGTAPGELEAEVIISPSAGAHVYKLAMFRSSGSGTVTNYAAAAYPSIITVEDITATPTAANGAPSSTLAYAEVLANQGSITTTDTDLTGLTTTITVPAGRRIRVSGKILAHSTILNDEVSLRLKEGATVLQEAPCTLSTVNGDESIDISWISSPSAGTHTYKLTLWRYNGTGTVTMGATAAIPAYILVEDITASTYTYSQPGVLPVSSTSLPSNPQIGAMVYEIDTGATKIWNGTAWQIFGQGSSTNLGYAQVTTNQSAITAETDLTGLAVTVTVPAGRRIQIIGQVTFTNTGVNQNVGSIKEGSTYLAQTALISGAAGTAESMSWSAITSPSAGTHTYKLVFQAIAGTAATATNANNPLFILVEDITGINAPAPAVNVPVGQLGYTFSETTIVTSGTTETDLGLSVNVVVPAGRTIRLTHHDRDITHNVANDVFLWKFKDNGVECGHRIHRVSGSGDPIGGMVWSAVVSPAAGSHVFTVTSTRNSGTGVETFNRFASGISRSGYLLVEDITPTPATATTTPSSTLAYAENFAHNQSFTNTYVDLPGSSLTVTVAAGRRIRISGKAHLSTGISNDRVILAIREGSTVLNDTYMIQPVAGIGQDMFVSAVTSPSTGAHTYVLSAIRQSGTGTGSVYSVAGDSGTYILIEDITGVGVSGHTHTELDDTGWISLVPLLINSWVSYDNTYGPPRYRKKAGIVYVQGLIKLGTLGAAVAVLPVGFRPTLRLLFATVGDSNVLNRYDVYADGQIINAAGPSNTFSSLDGITFPADQ